MSWLGLAAGVLLFAAPGAALEGPPAGAERAVYDEKADAKKDLATAIRHATRDNTRILVVFGANWCGWCHKLQELFEKESTIARTLLYEYELVHVDIGRGDKNAELAQSLGADLSRGVPFITVLDARGKPLAQQETSSLEAGDRHDPKKVVAFLKRWVAPPRDAEKVLADAMREAKQSTRQLLVHLGAPW